MQDLQHQTADFVNTHNLEADIASRVLDLISEVGEVSKEVLKGTDYGKTSFAPGPNWEGELGDTLFSLICIANSTGVDLEDALSTVLAKYQQRLANSQDAGSRR